MMDEMGSTHQNSNIRIEGVINYRKITVISVRGFGWAYERGSLYSGELISGIKKSFLNELLRNKLKLTNSIIKKGFRPNGL